MKISKIMANVLALVFWNFLTLSPRIVPEYKGGIVDPAFRMSNNSPMGHYMYGMKEPEGYVHLLIHILIASIIFFIFFMVSKRLIRRANHKSG